MKNWKVYFENYQYGLGDALKDNDWEYEAETEEEAWAWIEANENALIDPEESYNVYHAE
jgi:hypothetical protein